MCVGRGEGSTYSKSSMQRPRGCREQSRGWLIDLQPREQAREGVAGRKGGDVGRGPVGPMLLDHV